MVQISDTELIKKAFIGIDPGKNGGIVALDEDFNVIHKTPMPLIGSDLDSQILRDLLVRLKQSYLVYVCIEDVHSIFGASAKANFQFGRILGATESCIICSGSTWRKVEPKEWQKEAHVGIEKNSDKKVMSLMAAKRLKPLESWKTNDRANAKEHDGMYDAFLIAYYCMLYYTGETIPKERKRRIRE